MYEIKTVETKAQLSERLSSLSEVGREFVLKAAGARRHLWRVAKTLAVALNHLESLGLEDRGPLVWAQLQADQVGLGGRLGLEGASTAPNA